MKQSIIHPGDIVVAIAAAMTRYGSLANLGVGSGRSIGEAHNAVRRLRSSGLMAPDSRDIDRETLIQFIRWGIPVAFPPVITGETVGMGTAWISDHAGEFGAPEHVEFVWADAEGVNRGSALVPLHPKVPDVGRTSPKVYAALAAVDLVRVGGVRERTAAIDRIRQLLTAPDE